MMSSQHIQIPPQKIRNLRDSLKLTQRQAAQTLDVSQKTYLNWENGHHPMPLASWLGFIGLERCQAVRAELDSLLGER